MEMSTIQKLIEERAAKRLDADLNAIHSFMYKNKFLQQEDESTKLYYPGSPEGTFQLTTMRSLLSSSGYWTRKARTIWLPIYIKQETELFLKEFDQLKERMDKLEGEVANLEQHS